MGVAEPENQLFTRDLLTPGVHESESRVCTETEQITNEFITTLGISKHDTILVRDAMTGICQRFWDRI